MTGEKTLKFALIGAGGMGKRWAGALTSTAGAALALIVDLDMAKAEALAQKHNSRAASLDSALADSSINAAVVALPHRFLAKTSMALLSAGKHVLCEKPGAVTSDDMRKVIDTASSAGRRYMAGFNHRFHPSHQVAREIIDKGGIGEILFMRGRYGFGGREGYEKEWRHKKEASGGGQLIDQGIHLIDLARWFLGDMPEVKGFTEQAFWKSEVEDNVFFLLKNKTGRIASLHASWSQWKPIYSLEIFGSEGYILIDGLGKKYGGTERVYIGKRTADFKAEKEEMIECDTDADNSLREMLKEFVSAIRENRDPMPSARDAFAALEIIENIYAQQK